MKDTFYQAKLIDKNLIRIMVFSSAPWEVFKPTLLIDNDRESKLHFLKQSSMNGVGLCDFRVDEPVELGHSYKVITHRLGVVPLDISDYTTFPDFDEKYFYDRDDLGCTYSKEETTFVIWAPLASKVILKIIKNNENSYSYHRMAREETGVYRITLKGDFNGSFYKFLITNNEAEIETTDPYAKCSTLNGKESVVADFSSLKIDLNNDKLSEIKSPTDAIIYETHVRDFTISSFSNIENKGKFLGLVEENRKTINGQKAGFDYIKDLGITHIQLLPIYDYKTVDEKDPSSLYNWGYDPAQYFVPEGSYGSSEDPLSRIKNLKTLVSFFHKAGIRVSMDVVFNHVYNYENSVFEKVVPNYYFRRRENGILTNSSGCGNDLASEKPMVSKMLFDAAKFWIDEYGIDAYRFDLMGIIDCNLLNKIYEYGKLKNSSFLCYGEGWNMGSYSPNGVGTLENQNLIPDFGFFNDEFRNVTKYYFVGDDRFVQSIKSAFVGNCIPGFIKDAKYTNASKSLNYCECHDNSTLYDFIEKCDSNRSVEENLEILNAINCAVVFSFGMPFIHMGQEIGQSKWQEENTYNKGDFYNKFSYRLLEERSDCVEVLKKAISIKKSLNFLHICDPKTIDNSIEISDFNHIVHIEFTNTRIMKEFKQFHIYLNPNNEDENIELNNVEILFCSKENKKSCSNCTTIPSRSFIIFVER